MPPGQKAANYSDCAMKGLAVKPRRGDAVLFWSIRPNGSFDPKSLHGSCPVIKGVSCCVAACPAAALRGSRWYHNVCSAAAIGPDVHASSFLLTSADVFEFPLY